MKLWSRRRLPWDNAPPWAVEMRKLLERILTKEGYLMSAASDLNKAVSALAAAFSAEHDAVTAELEALAKAVSAGSDDSLRDAANQAIANINAITSKMAQDAAALTASVPAATTVAPPVATDPVVATPPTVTPPGIEPVAVTDPAAVPATS